MSFVSLTLRLLVAQAFVVACYVAGGSGWLYEKQYALYERELLQLRSDVERHYEAEPDGQRLLYALEQAYAVSATILDTDSEEIPEEAVYQLGSLTSGQTVVVSDLDLIYLRLGPRQVLEIDYLGNPLWIQFFPDAILSFLLLMTALGVFAWHRWVTARREAQLREQLAAIAPPEHDAAAQSAYSVEELVSRVEEQQQQLERGFERQLASHKDLLHGVAHEFRSPMARIRFALDMLPDHGDTEFDELRSSIDSNLSELDDMIGELLSFARLQHSGDVVFDEELFIEALIGDALRAVAPLYAETRFDFDAGSATNAVRGNAVQLVRALVNLLRNAGRHAKSRCQINVELHTADGDSERESVLVVHIDDDGEGIAPGKRERVFEPFTRLDPSRSRDSGGAGLGLPIVRSIIELHGGSVVAEDAPLGGARFTLRLPLAKSLSG